MLHWAKLKMFIFALFQSLKIIIILNKDYFKNHVIKMHLAIELALFTFNNQ